MNEYEYIDSEPSINQLYQTPPGLSSPQQEVLGMEVVPLSVPFGDGQGFKVTPVVGHKDHHQQENVQWSEPFPETSEYGWVKPQTNPHDTWTEIWENPNVSI